MEKDRSVAIIDEIRNRVVEGQNFPLQPSKVVLAREELIDLLDSLEGTVREELKAYREVTDRRAKILNDAKKEAEKILYEAEKSASRIRVTKRREGEPMNFSPAEMNAEEKKALRTAGDIYAASLIYTDEMLTEVDHLLADAYDKLDQEYKLMQGMLQAKKEAISENKAELLRSLNSLTKEDRYAQIMELSQLLSVELYREKEKQRAIEREKASQMEIQFDLEGSDTEAAENIPGFNPDRTPVKQEKKPEQVSSNRPAINPDRTPVSRNRTPVPLDAAKAKAERPAVPVSAAKAKTEKTERQSGTE
ncbi:MAG: hypothetical protein IJM27_02265 [Eubacterium sp.]|nr:hypothetical protein [Eubacterium sp.]